MDYTVDIWGVYTYYPLCLYCNPGFTLYETLNDTLYPHTAEVITHCTLPKKNDDGCMIHLNTFDMFGLLESSSCILCDARTGYYANQPVGRFTPGRSVCTKSK